MDVPLRVGDLLAQPYADWVQWHEADLVAGDAEIHVAFRLPTGEDQETVAAQAREDLAGAAGTLLCRCLLEIEVHRRPVDALPPAAAPALAEIMERLDPQALLVLRLHCPSCGTETSALFDTGRYLMEELTGRNHFLDREIHVMALHYHWSEGDILRLTSRRRQIYLDLLGEGVGGTETM